MKDSRTNNKMRASGGARQQGFTITETVVALLIMMIAGLGAISLFVFSTNYNSGAADRARGLALAQQHMEILRATAYGSLPIGTTNASENVGSPNTPDNDQRTFNVTTTVAYDPNVQNSHQKVITVTATPASAGRWSGGAVTLVCYRSENTVGGN
ncbi:MAG TPA: type II secretion system protein [Pyrinomonadaceae bacterium]|nr:type II secretion system protein [Pyrinomonadaceae bacterium]